MPERLAARHEFTMGMSLTMYVSQYPDPLRPKNPQHGSNLQVDTPASGPNDYKSTPPILLPSQYVILLPRSFDPRPPPLHFIPKAKASREAPGRPPSWIQVDLVFQRIHDLIHRTLTLAVELVLHVR
ncbi:hypothetical protein BJ508DRAFT_331899 [Ascobolus immersus RN42]|uniref:Uncharacterized protein n=1 Tax=Ascobolus immersus RN42 TaxID=1160509 RepID=A0A3N4HPE2_ASCIM|nr:hypothetical protein BJ508DRAFT_331899 [Ascobolus immersus RN42]